MVRVPGVKVKGGSENSTFPLNFKKSQNPPVLIGLIKSLYFQKQEDQHNTVLFPLFKIPLFDPFSTNNSPVTVLFF